jgi:hypothetical protein
VSLEKIINDSRETYYDALGASSPRWHDARHSTKPWMGYFLGVLSLSESLLVGRCRPAVAVGSRLAVG